MINKEHKRYVWLRADGEAKIVDTDIVELWQGPYFDREKDRIYELGAEVEIKVTVEVKNKTVYRENANAYRTPFENRD
jgi:RPA family protein